MADSDEWQPISETKFDPPQSGGGSGSGVSIVIILVASLFAGVVVIGILAAIAIPNFVAMQLRAKRAEAPATIDSMLPAVHAHILNGGEVPRIPLCPSATPGRDEVAWPQPCIDAWAAVGWTPMGPTRCSYELIEGPRGTGFVLSASCDLDGNGEYSVWHADEALPPRMATPNNVY